MSYLTIEPVTVDVSNVEDWSIQINDLDLDGNPISHMDDDLYAEVKDAQGNVVFTAEKGDELSIVPGTTNNILFTVPWGIVKDLPGAQYFAALIVIVSPTSRKKITDIIFRHEVQ